MKAFSREQLKSTALQVLHFSWKAIKGSWPFVKMLEKNMPYPLRWELSGARFLWEKINPPPAEKPSNYKPPVTISLWVIATYAAIFSFASNRYENKIDIIENRINAIITQLATDVYLKAFAQVANVQDMKCPLPPEFWKPWTVWFSLRKNDKYDAGVELLKDTVVTWKDKLEDAELNLADLSGAKLFNTKGFNSAINIDKAIYWRHGIIVHRFRSLGR